MCFLPQRVYIEYRVAEFSGVVVASPTLGVTWMFPDVVPSPWDIDTCIIEPEYDMSPREVLRSKSSLLLSLTIPSE